MAFKRFVFASDNHGDSQDPEAVKAFFRFLTHWKPHIRIHGGDNFDFRPMRKAADAEEKREALSADFEAGMEFLRKYKPTHFLRGNHDERLWDFSKQKTGMVAEYAAKLVGDVEKLIKGLDCPMLPYDRRKGILKIGKLKACHGFSTGVMAARTMAQVYGSIHFGHVHGIQSYSIPGMDNRVARCCGCLCLLDMDYDRANPGSLAHRHGWAYGIMDDRSGEYWTWQAESINGRWVIPTDVVEL